MNVCVIAFSFGLCVFFLSIHDVRVSACSFVLCVVAWQGSSISCNGELCFMYQHMPSVHSNPGLICIFHRYTFRKMLETWLKSWIHDASQISCVNPHKYSDRMIEFMGRTTS